MCNFFNKLLFLVLITGLSSVSTKKSKVKKAPTKATKSVKTIPKKVTDYCKLDCPVQNSTKVLCGSDGKEYTSLCHLKKESCLKNNSITLQHRGKCDCPDVCTKDYKPVCGSDDKTYPNICQLKKDACKRKGEKDKITFVKKGPCKPWKGSNCPSACDDIWAPVCGTDGKTYSSICSMKRATCTSTERIGLKKIGRCNTQQCPDFCPENHRPLCANNGKVYENECEMRLTACRTKKLTELKRASKKKICKSKCVTKCPTIENAVCGSNFLTYKNECEMYRQTCKLKKKVSVLKKGPCDVATDLQELPKVVVNMAPIHAPTIL